MSFCCKRSYVQIWQIIRNQNFYTINIEKFLLNECKATEYDKYEGHRNMKYKGRNYLRKVECPVGHMICPNLAERKELEC